MPEKNKSEEFRFRREALNKPPELMMTPMVDIVFQLLIFFMLAFRFRTSEGRINTFLPKNRGPGVEGTAEEILSKTRVKLLWVEQNSFRETKDPENGRVLLKVEKKNFNWVADKYGESLPDYDELYELILEARDKFKPTKKYKTLPVIIDARPLVPFKHIVHALNACLKARITDITFAAPEIPF